MIQSKEQQQLAQQQQKLAQQVIIPKQGAGYQPNPNDLIFGLDIQYVEDTAFIGVAIWRWGHGVEAIYVGQTAVTFPYIPRFFAFREGPPLLAMIRAIEKQQGRKPSLLLVDGHGLAHPRQFGVACWLGVYTNLPTIGCAKQTLLPYTNEPTKKRGNHAPITLNGQIVGSALVTQNNVKPVFVSMGHQITLNMAEQIILQLSPRYRLAQPLRLADQAARAYAKGTPLPNSTILSL